MVTSFCPACWQEVPPAAARCPHCSADRQAYAALSYEDKLLLALHHPVPENRMIAIGILGELRSQRALPVFQQFLTTETDFYLLQEVLYALDAIDTPESRALLEQARRHCSPLVGAVADALLAAE